MVCRVAQLQAATARAYLYVIATVKAGGEGGVWIVLLIVAPGNTIASYVTNSTTGVALTGGSICDAIAPLGSGSIKEVETDIIIVALDRFGFGKLDIAIEGKCGP